jgi:hypothetical protein
MDNVAHGCCDVNLILFQELLGSSYLQERREELGLRGGGGLFSDSLTVFLIIRQRLHGGCSLEKAWSLCTVQEVLALSPNSKRAQSGELSEFTSGFDYARHALPQCLVESAADRLYSEAMSLSSSAQAPVYFVDGSSLSLQNTPSIAKAYPPAENQYGPSHWPVVRVVVCHEFFTGIALRPEFGPMYGPGAVSEQALVAVLALRMPLECWVVADRNFGVFSVAWALRPRRLLFRLTEVRARAMLGKHASLNQAHDQPFSWRPSKNDRASTPGLSEDASIEGRLVVVQVVKPQSGEKMNLCLFTTESDSPEELARLYAARWNVETDLRSLKKTVGLETMRARSPSMLATELVLAVAAYNLVRTVMSLAAKQKAIDPRRLSYTRACVYVQSYAQRGVNTEQEIQSMLESIAAKPLPFRPDKKRPPRKQWHKRNKFPPRKVEAQ